MTIVKFTSTPSIESKFAASDRHWAAYMSNGFKQSDFDNATALAGQAIAEIKGARARLAYATGSTDYATNHEVGRNMGDAANHLHNMKQGQQTPSELIRKWLAEDGPSW